MATKSTPRLVVRGIPPCTLKYLKMLSVANGQSLSQVVRDILMTHVSALPPVKEPVKVELVIVEEKGFGQLKLAVYRFDRVLVKGVMRLRPAASHNPEFSARLLKELKPGAVLSWPRRLLNAKGDVIASAIIPVPASLPPGVRMLAEIV